MKPVRFVLLFLWLLPASQYGFAKQPPGKPVLSATPAPTPDVPPAQPPVTAATGPVNVDPSYIIGADDSIQVTVWKEPNLSSGLLVRPDGMISLPLIGDVAAAGLTPMGLATEITARLQKTFVTDPVVSVSVLAVNSKHIYLSGEINRVGPLPFTPGMTILQAILTAGGPSSFAKKKHIYILRGQAGKQQKITFDYTKAVKTGDMQGVSLMPGDVIVVP